MLYENIVRNIADPELEVDGVVLLCHRAGEDVRRAKLIVIFHLEFRKISPGDIVIRTGKENLAVVVGQSVHLLQEGVATGNHLILCESMVGDISVPACSLAVAVFKESYCLKHII